VYLDAAHQRLRHATSDEVNADASPQHSSAPTRSHDVWPFLSQGLSSLRNEPYFTAQHPLSPPSDTYGLTDGVNPDGDYPSETWQANSALLRTTFQKPPHHLPTPPTYDIQQPLQACANHLEWITNLMVNNTTSASADLSLTAYHRAMEISCHRRTRILRAKRLATRAMRQSGTSMALVATVKTGYTTNVHGQDRSIRSTCQNTLHDMEHLQYSLNSIEWRPCQQHSNQTVRPWLHRHPS
jgi:hypothetical protein